MHSFAARGATIRATATLAGHWSQAKQETYVGDTRAIYRHTVHVAREDLGTSGTDEDRISRYAQRISENRQRRASIHWQPDPTLEFALLHDNPSLTPKPGAAPAEVHQTLAPVGAARTFAGSPSVAFTTDGSPQTVSVNQRREQPGRSQERRPDVVDRPVAPLRHAPGVPAEPIARERWARETERLEALRVSANGGQQAIATPELLTGTIRPRNRPSLPTAPQPRPQSQTTRPRATGPSPTR